MTQPRRITLLLLAALVTLAARAQAPSLDSLMLSHGLVNVGAMSESISVDLKYATDDNFVGRQMYASLNAAYLLEPAAEALLVALEKLQAVDSAYGFVIYDAARPISAQREMWAIVEGTDKEQYVARPDKGGLHNFGVAVDISLTYRGEPVDMGTPFDTFDTRAHITCEDRLVKQGKISREARHNRRLLRKVMTQSGFNTLDCEWWHFTFCTADYARKNLQLLDF